MVYDFKTLVNRSAAGSLKWLEMQQKNPDIGPEIVPFSVADMELRNPPEIVEGLKKYLDCTVLGYTDPTQSYFDTVCGWMKRRHNWEIKPEWILCSDGVVPAFHNAVKAFTEPGDGVILMTPSYYPFYRAIANNHRILAPTQLVDRDGHYEINFEELERLARDPKNKLLLFCSPQNPVGRVWTPEELTRVGRICIDNNVLILSDEIHFDLIMSGYHHTVFATLCEEFAQHCIICTAPSKTFNIAGLEISNIIIPNDTLRKRYWDEEYTTGRERLNLLGYQACEIAYTQCGVWLSELLSLIQSNYEYVRDFMAKHFPEIKVYPLEGTYLLWMDFRSWGLSPQDLEDFMVHKALLFMDEGYVFGQGGEGFERINLACPAWVLEDALERFRKAAMDCGVREGNLSWKMVRLSAGDRMPDFTVDTPFIQGVQLEKLLGEHRTGILFLRYYGCTLCQYDMARLKAAYQQIATVGGEVIVVLQSSPERLAADAGSFPFAIICDPEQHLYRLLGIGAAEDDAVFFGGTARDKIVEAEKLFSHGAYEGDERQLPAFFILESNRHVTFAHYGKHIGDLPNIEDISQMLGGDT